VAASRALVTSSGNGTSNQWSSIGSSRPLQSSAAKGDATQRDAAADAAEANARAALAKQRLTELKAMLEEMRTERDAWREQAQRWALPKPEPEPAMTWWRWLRSTG
jgi:hypothetical protein